MRIVIDYSCRNCGCGEDVDEITITAWNELKNAVKDLEKSDQQCFNCSCKAHHWRWRRMPQEEEPDMVKKDKLNKEAFPQIFARTKDNDFDITKDEPIPDPIRPDTKEKI